MKGRIEDKRLLELISAVQDDSINEEDRQELNTLLKTDPEAREVYHRMVDLHVRLDTYYTESGSLAGLPDLQLPCGSAQQTKKTAYPLHWWMAIAAALLIGFFASTWLKKSPDEKSLAEPMVDGVAVLTKAVGLEWDESFLEDYREGDALPVGMLKVAQGFLQIEFFSGATVILEAPAEFELLSSERARLVSGKLSAFVPEPAQGFVIEGPDFDTIDLGTEFIMSVDPDGQGEVHVLDGEVSLHEKGGALIQNLSEGLGVRTTDQNALESVSSDLVSFVDREKLAALAAGDWKQLALNFERERQYWADNPDTVAYFDFEAAHPWQRRLQSARPDLPEGAIVGARWAQGRWPGKGALEFKNVNDRVRVKIPGKYEALTFSMRVRLYGLPRWSNGLFLTDGYERHGAHWQISENGEVSFGSRGVGSVSSPRVITPQDMGRWLHLVTVYESKQQRISHYLDGELIASAAVQGGGPLRIGDAEIGNWRPNKKHTNQIRSLTGTVDGFLIVKRALTATEVRQLYTQGYLTD